MKTVRDAVNAAARRLGTAKLVYGHGTQDALEEALFIVAAALKADPDTLPEKAARKLTAAQKGMIEETVRARIKTRRPAAYLLNHSWLQGLRFYVDERVIVPRSFIAELMAQGSLPVGPAKIKSVLDLCTGSGCLAVLAAHVFPGARIDAVELSEGAFSVAQKNIREHKLSRRVKVYQGDLFAPVRGKKYDLIITNPPYVAPASMKKLPPEYKAEPRMALEGFGKDGMDIVRRILKDAPRYLNAGGGILCEIGAGKKALEKSNPELPYLWLDTELSSGEVFWLAREDMLCFSLPRRGRGLLTALSET